VVDSNPETNEQASWFQSFASLATVNFYAECWRDQDRNYEFG